MAPASGRDQSAQAEPPSAHVDSKKTPLSRTLSLSLICSRSNCSWSSSSCCHFCSLTELQRPGKLLKSTGGPPKRQLPWLSPAMLEFLLKPPKKSLQISHTLAYYGRLKLDFSRVQKSTKLSFSSLAQRKKPQTWWNPPMLLLILSECVW